ncbi:MAG: hypothetical protein Pg6C_06550 [Treponemataceae bacterium]|nr:MAG: hypothetical protein Pg6C_06550 [Treponemataceae bacterium]
MPEVAEKAMLYYLRVLLLYAIGVRGGTICFAKTYGIVTDFHPGFSCPMGYGGSGISWQRAKLVFRLPFFQRLSMRQCVIALQLLALIFLRGIPLAAQNAAKRPSVALVLSGGGARGFAHIPILELIEELDIPIDMVIGNSAGSIIGGLFCAGYTARELKQVVFDLNWAEFFQDRPEAPMDSELGAHSLYAKPINLKFSSGFMLDFGKGFATGERAYALFKTLTARIPSYIDFDSLPIPFRAIAVNFQTGELEVFKEGDLAEAIRASISLPAIFEPFPINGKYYLDGVVRNNTPIQQAKDLGYDIIIVVEMYGETSKDNPSIDTSSAMSIPQVFNIYLNTINSQQQGLADVILTPDLRGLTMFDYSKAREIYNRGIEEKPKFREQLIKVRKKIYPNQPAQAQTPAARTSGAIRQETDGAGHTFSLIGVENSVPEREGKYAKLPDIVIQNLVTSGAVSSDEQYIETQFLKTLAGKPLTRNTLNNFIFSIYKTGNYTFVITRTDMRRGSNNLELILYQAVREKTLFLFGTEYQSTITSDSIVKLAVSTDIQFRGLTGAGSVLAFGIDFVNKTAAEIMFMQPLNPNVYTMFSAYINMDQDFISSGLESARLSGNRIVSAGTKMTLGVKFNDNHSMRITPGLAWFDTDEGFTEALSSAVKEHPDSRSNAAVPITAQYIFTTLDYQMLPMSGYYVKAANTTVFPLTRGELPVAYNVVEANFSAVIPVGDRFSIAANAFAGSDVTRILQDIPYHIPVFGYNSFDRMYFPHIAGKKIYGAHKGALQIVLLFQPWDNVTILGGQIIFSTAVSAGEIEMRYEDFHKDKLYWNTSFNTGIRINRALGIQFRMGAGMVNQEIAPFLSLDIGTIRF